MRAVPLVIRALLLVLAAGVPSVGDADVAGRPSPSGCAIVHDASTNTISFHSRCTADDMRAPLRRAIVLATAEEGAAGGDGRTALGYRFRRPPPPERPGGRYFGQRQ